MTITSTELFYRVDSDPRMVAADAALSAFNASEAGQALHEACMAADYRERMASLDEDIKDRYVAHAENWHRTRVLVRRELGGM